MIADILNNTPYFLGGFGINALIAVTALLWGAVFGLLLGRLRGGSGLMARLAMGFTRFCRPGWRLALMAILLLGLAVLLGGWVGDMSMPAWLVTALLLSVPVMGLASDRFATFFQQMRAGELGAERSFFAAWLRTVPLVFIASALGGLLGSSEVVFRAAQFAQTQASSGAVIFLFLYIASWFALAAMVFFRSAKRVARRVPKDPGGVKAVRLLRQRRRPAYKPRQTLRRNSAPSLHKIPDTEF
ncbi:MAG: hypothetical protein OIF40_07235 [Mangrovicoccus sp.]|nr:hypothetical protein [Mangrovicoccus sp.]